MTLPLPLETARRIARAAISSLDVSLRLDVDAIAPTYSWVVVTLSSHQLNGHAGETLRRNIRESLRVLTALAACKGFAVKENATFWRRVAGGSGVRAAAAAMGCQVEASASERTPDAFN
ncbi:hypothetical protein PF005_g7773 [Phytophthora fragariae]|uniref:Uncharacterized protein n=1 Tax=Phytophthora fragariae TaxID=53985 RepID=A0A6A3FAH4_9STRA|nr:hypothetical protein PF003_g1032 [Phytophthora fragariae]KAE8941626.1 hypothetical protein PF009_g8576 [Phytophthora fragariae]KAE9019473.1 hypothetical protein PF011_g5821 [Phytophthora fragariae]KAE9102407.1 hypothetical protein PF010_g14115 [Phytophthora fragariae]KAE9120772.1 hypothetical protein PF007_g8040 [Phytophthora fragariae]